MRDEKIGPNKPVGVVNFLISAAEMFMHRATFKGMHRVFFGVTEEI